MAWLAEQEEYLKNCGPVADTYDNLVAQLEEHKVGQVQLRGCSLGGGVVHFLIVFLFWKHLNVVLRVLNLLKFSCPMVDTLIIFVFHVKIMLFL